MRPPFPWPRHARDTVPMSASEHADLIARIDTCLPQTQCTRCGYPDCRAYAEAIATGRAHINRCPPGDNGTLRALAATLSVPVIALDPACGPHLPRTRALIDEQVCIGCRKCVDACPVDAIIGARKLMHTVMVADCTGCELCLPPCPVDCIHMVEIPAPSASDSLWTEYTSEEANRWRRLAQAHRTRIARRGVTRRATRPTPTPASPRREEERARIRTEIRAAVARARARKREP